MSCFIPDKQGEICISLGQKISVQSKWWRESLIIFSRDNAVAIMASSSISYQTSHKNLDQTCETGLQMLMSCAQKSNWCIQWFQNSKSRSKSRPDG
jgi:hypothetical protein